MMTVALTLDEAERRGVVIEDFSYYNASYVNVFKDIMSNIRFGGVTVLSVIKLQGRKEMFYLTTHSAHFIYGYMVSDIIW